VKETRTHATLSRHFKNCLIADDGFSFMNHVVNHYELSQEEITAYIILSAFIITDDSDFMKNVIIIFAYEYNNINTPLLHRNTKQ
jgi:hypothetical protein